MKPSKAIIIPALALTAGISLAACGTLKVPATAPTVTHTVTAPAATPKPSATTAPATPAATTPAPQPAKTVYVQAPAPAAPALTDCGGDVYAGSDTSCPFALNVAQDYTGPGADFAYSPVTGLNYIMNCGVGGAGTVICTGGDNAYVQF